MRGDIDIEITDEEAVGCGILVIALIASLFLSVGIGIYKWGFGGFFIGLGLWVVAVALLFWAIAFFSKSDKG